jgi:hypothetical protein
MDYLYAAVAGKPAPEFREALRILSAPVVHKLGPNPLGLSAEMRAKIAAWNKQA